MFRHGTYTSEANTSSSIITEVKNPIFVVGTASINMGDPQNINKPQLITTLEEATKYFGGTGVEGFTINETLNAIINTYNVLPIICVNVINPDLHKTSETKSNLIVKNKKITIERIGILQETLVIKNAGVALNNNIDYTFQFENNGCITIDIIKTGLTSVDVEYEYLDPTKVQKEDVIGGINPTTLKKTGLETISEVFMKYSMIPGMIIAPEFSKFPEVKNAIDSKCTSIGKYQTIGIVDLPDDIEYGNAIQKKKELNIISSNLICCFGKGKIGEQIYPLSTLIAGLMSSIDSKNDGIPYESPSNKNLKINALVVKNSNGDYEEILLEEEAQANILNENGIVTAINRSNGFVCWGNRTSEFQPGGDTDPKNIWIPIKRMLKFIGNILILNTSKDIDKPMSYSLAEQIQNTINIYLNSLVSSQKLLGGRIEFKSEENPLSEMLNGKFKWHIYLGCVLPLESAHFIIEYDTKYQETFAINLASK